MIGIFILKIKVNIWKSEQDRKVLFLIEKQKKERKTAWKQLYHPASQQQ